MNGIALDYGSVTDAREWLAEEQGDREARRHPGHAFEEIIGTSAALKPSPTGGGMLEDVQREYILQVLRETRWAIGGSDGAAARLGLKRTTLLSKMARLGIAHQAR
jgi:transcriptional regulator of acetoin/glycerol metabolism